MKRIFTFIISYFFVVHLYGQPQNSDLRGKEEFIYFINELTVNENFEGRISKPCVGVNCQLYNHLPSKLKSVQATKELLDSTISETINKSTGQFGISEKNKYSYDLQGRTVEVLYFDWKGNPGQWIVSGKFQSGYDSNGNLIKQAFFSLDDSNNWMGSSMIEWKKDSFGNILQMIFFVWDITNNEWVSSGKYEYIYDTQGNQIGNFYYYWDKNTNTWVVFEKTENTFNANGNMTQSIVYSLSETIWVYSSKKENTYDSNGNIILSISYEWNKYANLWVDYKKTEYTYNSLGKTTLEINYNWEKEASKWTGVYKYESIYNPDGNMARFVGYKWELNTWNSNLEYYYSYNSNGNKSQFEAYELNADSGSFYLSRRTTYYYSQQDVTNTSSLKEDIRIYPNPVNAGFQVSGIAESSSLELFDMNGKLVLKKVIVNNQYIPVSSLPNGMYFIKIISNNKKMEQKIILHHSM